MRDSAVNRSARGAALHLSLLPLLLVLSACSADDLLGADDRTWLWLVTPLVAVALAGSIVVSWRRRDQLESWSLSDDATDPGVRRLLFGTLGVGLFLILAFVVLNFRLEIDPDQRLRNIVLWILGTTLGCLGAVFIGLKTAEPSPKAGKGRR